MILFQNRLKVWISDWPADTVEELPQLGQAGPAPGGGERGAGAPGLSRDVEPEDLLFILSP